MKIQRKIKGFTLMGLMAAVAISAIAIVSSLMVFINCMFLNESNSNLVIAANDAHYILEEVKALAYDDIDAYSPVQFSNLSSEAITVHVQENVSWIKEVEVTVAWIEKGRNKSFELSTRIAR